MSDDSTVSVRFDRYIGTLSVSLGEKQITIDNLQEAVEFLQGGEGDADLRPLWLSHLEADTLGKMIRYILKQVKISDQSRQVLDTMLPRIDAIRDESAREQE